MEVHYGVHLQHWNSVRDSIQFHMVSYGSAIKSCLLDPWPTFLFKECSDILIPSITKLFNTLLIEGRVLNGFKNIVVTLLIKKASLPADDIKNYHSVSSFSFT